MTFLAYTKCRNIIKCKYKISNISNPKLILLDHNLNEKFMIIMLNFVVRQFTRSHFMINTVLYKIIKYLFSVMPHALFHLPQVGWFYSRKNILFYVTISISSCSWMKVWSTHYIQFILLNDLTACLSAPTQTP